MKRIAVCLLLCVGKAWAGGGGANPLTVSSGTFQGVSMYSNDDGANRQTVIIGNRTSSATVTIDPVTGMTVNLATSAISLPINTTNISTITFNGIAQPETPSQSVDSSLNASVSIKGSSNTVQAQESGFWAINVYQPSPSTVTVLQAVQLASGTATNPLNITGSISNVSFNAYLPSPSSVTQSGVWNLSATTVGVVGTITANQGGAPWSETGSSITIFAPNNNTTAIPISGSLAVNNPSTGTVNAGVPGIGTLVAGSGISGNTALFRLDSSSNLYVNVAAGGAGGGVADLQIRNVSNAWTDVGYGGTTISSVPVAIMGGSISNPSFNVYQPSPSSATQSGFWAVNAYQPSPSTATVLQAVFLASGTATNPLNVTVPLAVFLASGTATNPFNITGSISNSSFNAYLPSPSTVTVLQAVQLASTTFIVTLTTVTFNGVQQPVTVQNSTVSVTGFLGDNGAANTTNRVGTLPGAYASDYLDGTATTDDRDAALSVGNRDGGLRVTQILNLTDHSFSASTNSYTVPDSTIDISGLCGNGISTVAVVGIRVSASQTTAGLIAINVVRRSSAYIGIFSTMAASGYDPTIYSVPTSSAVFFTTTDGHQLNGTFVSYLDGAQIGAMASATAVPNDIYISPASWRTDPPILRTVNQCLGINTNNTAVSGGKFTVSWFWKELTSP
jgi:hypothetical protein